jgi:hypothetical protein
MRFKSMAKDLKETIKEILGTAFSVGQVHVQSSKGISDDFKTGEFESKSSLALSREPEVSLSLSLLVPEE